jgi:hypothetical protein
MTTKKIINCKRCKDKDTCTKPCDLLEKRLRKDFPLNTNVKDDISPSFPIPSDTTPGEVNIWDILSNVPRYKRLSVKEKVVLTLDALHFSRSKIGKLLKMTRGNLRLTILHAKKKIKNI